MTTLPRDDRGRITVPDVLFVLYSLAFLAVLWQPVWDGLENNSAIMPTGTVYLFRMFLPFAAIVMMAMIYVKAVRGANV